MRKSLQVKISGEEHTKGGSEEPAAAGAAEAAGDAGDAGDHRFR